MFDHKKFLSADEQTQRQIIAEVISEKSWKHQWECVSSDYDDVGVLGTFRCKKCRRYEYRKRSVSTIEDKVCIIPDPVTESFEVLAFRLMNSVKHKRLEKSFRCLYEDYCDNTINAMEETAKTFLMPDSFDVWLIKQIPNAKVVICATLMAWPEKESK